jgi:hypothetical protein
LDTAVLKLLFAMAAVLLVVNGVNAQSNGQTPMRAVPIQSGGGPPQTRVIEGQPAGESEDGPLPQQERQVGPRMEAGAAGGDSRAGGRGASRQTIRVAPGRRVMPQGRWRLGVYFDDSPRGLRIRQVVRPSAASRLGLEEGDYLLDIMGYPLGLYNNYYYSLEGVMNRVTPPDGWVNLLVWNKRTMAEEAMWVQLERRGGVTTLPTRTPTMRSQDEAR